MKKIVLYLSLVIAGGFTLSCEKETINKVEVEQTRILSSNPDEIFVQDPSTSEWITLTDFNKRYPNQSKVGSYANRLCIVRNGDGTETNGSVCGPSDNSGCPAQGQICVTKK